VFHGGLRYPLGWRHKREIPDTFREFGINTRLGIEYQAFLAAFWWYSILNSTADPALTEELLTRKEQKMWHEHASMASDVDAHSTFGYMSEGRAILLYRLEHAEATGRAGPILTPDQLRQLHFARRPKRRPAASVVCHSDFRGR
jgi:hypothetical protein